MSGLITRAEGSAVDDAPPMPPHMHRRLRREVVLRTLEVLRVERLTPHMQRVILGGDGLQGFQSGAPDDHVKLFFPNRLGELVLPAAGPEGLVFPPGREPSPMRDYTPRRHVPERNELCIDFVLHGDGPAARWAEQAAPGQRVGLGGPRGSFVVADDFERYVLVGDETALPAIGRWLEEMPAGVQAMALIEVADARDRQPLSSRAQARIVWLERDLAAAAGQGALERMLRNLPADPRDTFYWIAAESARARAMRQWLDQQGVPKDWIRATGYWKAEPSDAPA
jgi:NADPH-dependent ferric siderophore reductase